MTPNVAVAILQMLICLLVVSYFIPRLYALLTRFRHNRDGQLIYRVQQKLLSFALLLIASYGFATRLDMIVHANPDDRWFKPPGDRWEDAIVWGVMLVAVAIYWYLYWVKERR